MLSGPGALPPSELHVTLAYLGKVDDLSSEQVKEVHDLMRLISENHSPLPGHINGCGRFCNGDDDGDPFFIIPDLAALPNLRQVIIDGLRSCNIDVSSEHGFTPHITLTYLPHAEHNPFHSLEKTPVSFGAISLVLGDDRYDYPLAQGVPLLSRKALVEIVTKHAPGKHSQKTHAGKGARGKGGGKKAAKKPTSASSILKDLPNNLGLLETKRRNKIISQLSELSTDELTKAFADNNKKLDSAKSDLELRNALIQSKWLEQATKKKVKRLKKQQPKAAKSDYDVLGDIANISVLIEKIGARHTQSEAGLIQKAEERKKHKLEVEATKTVFERFKRFLAMLSYNTSVGHSANFGMFADGDGADYLKVNNLDLSRYIKELKDFQAKYNSIEMAGEDGYYSLKLESRANPTKAALIEKIGARHTGAERGTIQKIHNLTLDLGGECHPLTRRAGARHSQGDQVMVQRIHDDCSELGAVCKATPEKDRVYSSQVLKEGLKVNKADYHKGGLLSKEDYILLAFGSSERSEIIKAQSDAPNYKPASTPQRCANCRFFLGDPGRDWCDLFDFTADQDYVCDSWETQRPDEIPGYVANKGILTLRNWENSTLIQRKARDAVNNAIKAGTLKKANTKMCFRCDKRPGVEYHHIDGYSENKKLNVRAVCYECHSSLTRKAGLAALTEGILTLRGSAGSGNFGHIGRPGKLGGSAGGGGLKRIGAKKKSSPAARKKAAKKFGTKQAAKGEPTSKKPAAKPKKPAKKLAAKPKPQPVVKPVAAKKPTTKPEDQGLNQKDAKKFGWLSKEMAGFEKDNAGAKIESGAVYSKDGKELFRVKGDENAVDFNESQLRQMKGAVVTHNHPVVTGHPDGGSFSPSDIRLMFNTDAAEVRAVTENYIHVVKPKKFGGRTNKNALNFFDKRKKEAQVKVSKQLKAGKLKRNEFAVEFWHEVWRSAAEDGLIEYKRIKR